MAVGVGQGLLEEQGGAESGEEYRIRIQEKNTGYRVRKQDKNAG